jgi:hypothetical protein
LQPRSTTWRKSSSPTPAETSWPTRCAGFNLVRLNRHALGSFTNSRECTFQRELCDAMVAVGSRRIACGVTRLDLGDDLDLKLTYFIQAEEDAVPENCIFFCRPTSFANAARPPPQLADGPTGRLKRLPFERISGPAAGLLGCLDCSRSDQRPVGVCRGAAPFDRHEVGGLADQVPPGTACPPARSVTATAAGSGSLGGVMAASLLRMCRP